MMNYLAYPIILLSLSQNMVSALYIGMGKVYNGANVWGYDR